jgi:peptidoglycan/LPS O-acetylase OafA/YrhL
MRQGQSIPAAARRTTPRKPQFGSMISMTSGESTETIVHASMPRLDSLTGLRFFAAVIIVLSHSTGGLARFDGASFFLDPGRIGVTFFFALSGFLLTWSSSGGKKSTFYRRRFARVYPLHFVMWLVLLIVLVLFGNGVSPVEAFATLLLIQTWFPASNIYYGVNWSSWTLSCEAFFYAVFPFLRGWFDRFRIRPVHVLALILVYGALMVALSVFVAQPQWIAYIFPPVRIMEFIAGMLIAMLMKSGWRPPLTLGKAATLLIILYVVIAWPLQLAIGSQIVIFNALALPALLALIAAAAQSDLVDSPSWLRKSTFQRLGEWSFALYLTHLFVLQVFVKVFPGLDQASVVERIFVTLLFVVTAMGVAIAAYYLVEKPLEKKFRGSKPRVEMAVTGRQ